jgi:hypothetical protein
LLEDYLAAPPVPITRDPAAFVDQVIECAKEFRLTADDLWKEFDSRSLADLQAEIAANLSAAVKLTGPAKTALQKNKPMIADTYGAAEIGECLNAVFEDFYLLLMTFDTFALKQNLETVCQRIGKKVSMPKSLWPMRPVAWTKWLRLKDSVTFSAMSAVGNYSRPAS